MTMSRFIRRALPLLMLPLLAACQPELVKFSGPTMGSSYTISYVREGEAPEAAEMQAEVEEMLRELDAAVSTYRDDSEVARFNAAPAGICLLMPPVLTQTLVPYAQQLNQQSEGAFDITLLPALDAWGFGPKAAAARQKPIQPGSRIDKLDASRAASPPAPDEAALAALRKQVGMQYLRIDGNRLCKLAPISIDFNSIAAGAVIDQIADRMQAHGINRYLIEVTGEIRGQGTKPDGSPWRIAIEAPLDKVRQAQRIVTLDGMSVSNSGDYRNYREESGQRLSHLLDARSLRPVTHRLAAVTVVHPQAMQADGLSTLLMALGPDQGQAFARQHDIAALFVSRTDKGFVTTTTPAFDKLYPLPGK